jgi:hypothetical protein
MKKSILTPKQPSPRPPYIHCHLRRTLQKALNEVAVGNPETAETLIEWAILQDSETTALIERLVSTLESAHFRLEISNYAGEEDETLTAIASAVAAAKGGAI